MDGSISIFYFIVLILSIMVHEVAHGLLAEQEGDPTARLLGRITLNPLKHIDWVGSILLPLVLILTHAGFVIGWAKPVPYVPENLKRGNKSLMLVSIAGIVTNLIIATFFGLFLRAGLYFGFVTSSMATLATIVILVNTVLALFNSIPLAPLDGFNFLTAVLPHNFKTRKFLQQLEAFSLPILLLFIVFGWGILSPIVTGFYHLLTGLAISL